MSGDGSDVVEWARGRAQCTDIHVEAAIVSLAVSFTNVSVKVKGKVVLFIIYILN